MSEILHDVPGDRIAMPSRRADGTLDQTNPKFIGDDDATKKAIERQVQQQATAAVDLAEADRERTADEQTTPDPSVVERLRTAESVKEVAAKQADAEIATFGSTVATATATPELEQKEAESTTTPDFDAEARAEAQAEASDGGDIPADAPPSQGGTVDDDSTS